MTPVPPSPNACRHCGLDLREYMQQWKPPVGWQNARRENGWEDSDGRTACPAHNTTQEPPR